MKSLLGAAENVRALDALERTHEFKLPNVLAGESIWSFQFDPHPKSAGKCIWIVEHRQLPSDEMSNYIWNLPVRNWYTSLCDWKSRSKCRSKQRSTAIIAEPQTTHTHLQTDSRLTCSFRNFECQCLFCCVLFNRPHRHEGCLLNNFVSFHLKFTCSLPVVSACLKTNFWQFWTTCLWSDFSSCHVSRFLNLKSSSFPNLFLVPFSFLVISKIFESLIQKLRKFLISKV